MTYAELSEAIGQMNNEQKDSDVTIWTDDEFHAAKLMFNKYADVWDVYHPYLMREL